MIHDAFEELPSQDFSPRADVYRKSNGWVVKFDLAGVRPEDVKLTAKGCFIQIVGVRRDEFVERGLRHHSMEISYSRFQRTLRLPCEAEGAGITTEYSNGLLVVTIETGN